MQQRSATAKRSSRLEHETLTRLSHYGDIGDILAVAPCTNKEEKIDDFHGLMQSTVCTCPGSFPTLAAQLHAFSHSGACSFQPVSSLECRLRPVRRASSLSRTSKTSSSRKCEQDIARHSTFSRNPSDVSSAHTSRALLGASDHALTTRAWPWSNRRVATDARCPMQTTTRYSLSIVYMNRPEASSAAYTTLAIWGRHRSWC